MSKDLILRFAIIGTDPNTKDQVKLGTKAVQLKSAEQICKVQERVRGKLCHLKYLHPNPSESGKIEDLARQHKLDPDSAQCLFLPPFEGKRGVWLQPERTFADYMEGVRIFKTIWKVPILKYFGRNALG